MIEVNNLTKCYGQHKAIDNISFTVDDGEIVGFLGPNGAGKTTTMNIMTGYISSTNGTVVINGFDILEKPEKAKSQIGYLPDFPPLYGDMTVIEYLNFVCDIKSVKKSNRKKMIDEILGIVKIGNVSKRIIKNLSKGYRQRVGLAQALIGFPEVLILDEPTTGLDPKQIIEMRDVIKTLGKRHTIILSSHILSEISAVCDRVIIISKGKIVASDTPENLSKGLSQGHRLVLRIKGSQEDIQKAFNIESDIIDTIEFDAVREEGTYDIVLKSKDDKDIREIVFRKLAKNNLPILMMKPLDLSLEDIFLQVTDNDSSNKNIGINKNTGVENEASNNDSSDKNTSIENEISNNDSSHEDSSHENDNLSK